MGDRVSVSISNGVADVRLMRADKMNALDAAMFDALVARHNGSFGGGWWLWLDRTRRAVDAAWYVCAPPVPREEDSGR